MFTQELSERLGHLGWLSVTYEDGRDWPIVHGFQFSQFDGMDDIYHRIEPTLYARHILN